MVGQKDSARVRVLVGAERVQMRVSELAAAISRDYSAADGFVAVGILKGSVFFLSDLLKQVTVPVELDFFQTSSYAAGTSPGEVRILRDIGLPIRGRDVLLVEDIVDTGWTLRTILDLFRYRGARSVKLCALLDKAAARKTPIPIDYVGFEIGNEFLVGYGLDWNERFRNLPYIGALEGEGEKR